jgi:N-methylhydantoinase B
MDRFRFRPFGLHGGEAGAPGRLLLIRDGEDQPLDAKVSNMRLQKGDIIRLVTSGGGGLGPDVERSAAARIADRAAGYTRG